MTCTAAREQIVELEAGREPSPELARHLEACEGCRRLFDRLRRLEAATPVVGPPVPRAADAFTARVMRAVHEARAEPKASSPAVGLRGWTAGSLVIVASLVAIQFSDVVDWLRGSLGPVIDVAIATMLGLALTAYLLLLVGSNLTTVRRALRWLAR